MSMRMTRSLMIIIIVIVLIDKIFGIHFRGGTYYWAPVSKTPTSTVNVSFVQSYSWVRTYEFCDSSTIATQGLIGINQTQLQCIWDCTTDGNYCDCISTLVICTDYSVTNDLSSGQKMTFVPISLNAMFYISYQDGNWLTLATAASATWSITSYVNLNPRSDNGLLNTPPIVSVLPVIYLPVSVQSVINLLVVDIDNDYTQCRWAQLGNVDECGGICQSVPGSQLLSNCSLIFTPTATQVYYAAAIMVEDFYSTAATIPLSSTPVQFLIYTYNSPTSCSALPIITGPYSDQSCLSSTVGVTFSFTLTAEIGCPGTTIIDFVTVSPFGMIKATSITTVSTTVYSLSFAWTPSSLQVGASIFCAAAVATYNIQSQQVCYKFIVSLVANPNSCPLTTTTIATTSMTESTASTGQNDSMQYIFLGIGIGAGFLMAMLSMWAIHYFLNRQVCCLKPRDNYQQKLDSTYMSAPISSQQPFT